MDNDSLEEPLAQDGEKRFKILVCIDGSEESYRGLRYAVRLGTGWDTELVLLYIREADTDIHTDGLDMRMARENMLEWGLELPGMTALKRGLDVLMDLGYMNNNWSSETTHLDHKGDPLGDNVVEYTNEDGGKVSLKLMVAPSPELGILDESDVGEYDITIVSAADSDEENDKTLIFGSSVSERIATESKKSVIVAKALEENHGHLICLNGSLEALNTARDEAIMASRCNCPVTLYSVAANKNQIHKAQAIIDEARTVIEDAGFQVAGEKIGIGDPVEEIIEEGQNYSLIVLAAEEKVGLKQFFKSTVNFKILEGAKNSVLIRR